MRTRLYSYKCLTEETHFIFFKNYYKSIKKSMKKEEEKRLTCTLFHLLCGLYLDTFINARPIYITLRDDDQ